MAISFVNAATNSGDDTGSLDITCGIPSGTQADDFMICLIQTKTSSGTFTDPSGWTSISGATYLAFESNVKSKLYTKIATGSDSSIAITQSLPRHWAATVVTYRGVDTTTPFDTTQGTGWQTTTDSDAAITTASLTASDQWYFSAIVDTSAAALTHTCTDTERSDVAATGGTAASSSISTADTNGNVTGARTNTFTPSAANLSSGSWAILLNPAAASGPPIPPRIFGTVW